MLKSLTMTLAVGASLLTGAAAQAHEWNTWGRNDGYQRDWRDQRGMDRDLIQSTCSGERGYNLEVRLQREVREGDIDRGSARRIQREIDRLQNKERHECREGDFREVRDISNGYIRLRAWIDRESGDGYRSRPAEWRRGW
jgi:hypothetical protein